MIGSRDDYTWSVESLRNGRVLRYRPKVGGAPLSYAQVIDLWFKRESFTSAFTTLLRDSKFAAYFWETPPVTRETVNERFEFVLVDSPELAAVRPDDQAFADYFRTAAADQAVTFSNLRNDATLVAPCPRAANPGYAHLAVFARHAPEDQQSEFWRQVGRAVRNGIGQLPVWLSTSGLGIHWLHVRIDSIPKYYVYDPYRIAAPPSVVQYP